MFEIEGGVTVTVGGQKNDMEKKKVLVEAQYYAVEKFVGTGGGLGGAAIGGQLKL